MDELKISEKRKEKTMKTGNVLCMAAALLGACVGCDEAKKEQIRNAAHKAIIEYVENKGQEQAETYIDKLVADGKIGAENAAKIKAAIPAGVDKVKAVMGKVETNEVTK